MLAIACADTEQLQRKWLLESVSYRFRLHCAVTLSFRKRSHKRSKRPRSVTQNATTESLSIIFLSRELSYPYGFMLLSSKVLLYATGVCQMVANLFWLELSFNKLVETLI